MAFGKKKKPIDDAPEEVESEPISLTETKGDLNDVQYFDKANSAYEKFFDEAIKLGTQGRNKQATDAIGAIHDVKNRMAPILRRHARDFPPDTNILRRFNENDGLHNRPQSDVKVNDYSTPFMSETYYWGSMVYDDDTFYEGLLVDGECHGHGVMTFGSLGGAGIVGVKLGDEYQGEFKDHYAHGLGVYRSTEGWFHVGEWREGMKHGCGARVEARAVFDLRREFPDKSPEEILQMAVAKGIGKPRYGTWEKDVYIGHTDNANEENNLCDRGEALGTVEEAMEVSMIARMFQHMPNGDVLEHASVTPDGLPSEPMNDPLHYPKGGEFMMPGPAGQMFSLPDDPNVIQLLDAGERTRAHVFKQYNIDLSNFNEEEYQQAKHNHDLDLAFQNRWTTPDGSAPIRNPTLPPEVAINNFPIADRPVRDFLSILIHEMPETQVAWCDFHDGKENEGLDEEQRWGRFVAKFEDEQIAKGLLTIEECLTFAELNMITPESLEWGRLLGREDGNIIIERFRGSDDEKGMQGMTYLRANKAPYTEKNGPWIPGKDLDNGELHWPEMTMYRQGSNPYSPYWKERGYDKKKKMRDTLDDDDSDDDDDDDEDDEDEDEDEEEVPATAGAASISMAMQRLAPPSRVARAMGRAFQRAARRCAPPARGAGGVRAQAARRAARGEASRRETFARRLAGGDGADALPIISISLPLPGSGTAHALQASRR